MAQHVSWGMIDPAGDLDLGRRIALGDVNALAALYDRHARLAYSVAYGVLHDEGRAEDMVQEAFLLLWSHAASFDSSKGSLVSWLVVLTRNRSIDQLRGKTGRQRQELGLTADIQSPGDPAVEALRRLDAEVVRKSVRALPRLQREALELAYFRGHTAPEIAEMTMVPLSTVKGRLRLALEKLHSYLAGWQDQVAVA